MTSPTIRLPRSCDLAVVTNVGPECHGQAVSTTEKLTKPLKIKVSAVLSVPARRLFEKFLNRLARTLPTGLPNSM
jgi:hypothetical protein